jgi:rRNA maturation protein Nop10
MNVKFSGRKVITFECGNYTVRELFAPTPDKCPHCGGKVKSVQNEQPRIDEYDQKTKTWKIVG